MSVKELRELEKICEAATPGPWCVWGTTHDNMIAQHQEAENCNHTPVLRGYNDYLKGRMEDKRFITAARTAMPELIAEVRKLRSAIEKLECRTLIPRKPEQTELYPDTHVIYVPCGECDICKAKEAL